MTRVGARSTLAMTLAASLCAHPAGADGSAEALARRLDARHAGLRDLSAQFTQTYRSGLLGREVVERGLVQIKRPGRMRWEYRDPERKTFVSDGRTFWFYVPRDKQVIVREQAGARGLPTLLLSGQGRIADEFQVSLESALEGRRLRLVPRRPDPEIETVLLEIDAEERVVAIEVLDVQGNRSRFRFSHLRENTGLREELFRFEVPRGVEVVAG